MDRKWEEGKEWVILVAFIFGIHQRVYYHVTNNSSHSPIETVIVLTKISLGKLSFSVAWKVVYKE
jgi:hypothetical protein